MKKHLLLLFLSSFSMLDAQNIQEYDLKKMKQPDMDGYRIEKNISLLKDSDGNLITIGKAGKAYPLLFDWNKDGKKDLMVGEFGGGKLSNIRVYINEGSADSPVFSKDWFYATDLGGEKLYIYGS